jgi:uncharacterized RDD family membrane protein YckC
VNDEERYIGLATRVVGFALDAAVIDVVALIVGVGAGLILSLFKVGGDLKTVLLAVGAALYVLWIIGYFVGFWSATGETPGSRIMRFRVMARGGERLKPRRALLRCFGLVLSALPLFAGYLMILFDSERRALHDRIARTVVVESPRLSIAAARRARRQAERELRSSHSGDERGAAVSQA